MENPPFWFYVWSIVGPLIGIAVGQMAGYFTARKQVTLEQDLTRRKELAAEIRMRGADLAAECRVHYMKAGMVLERDISATEDLEKAFFAFTTLLDPDSPMQRAAIQLATKTRLRATEAKRWSADQEPPDEYGYGIVNLAQAVQLVAKSIVDGEEKRSIELMSALELSSGESDSDKD